MSSNLLVVHSDKEVAKRINQVLINEGYQSQWVTDMAAAAAHLTPQPPDLLILPQTLSESTTDKTIPWLRNTPRTANMLILVLIPNTVEARVMALEWGADGYLVLPLDEHELVTTVRALIERSARLQKGAMHEPGRIFTFFSAKGGVGTTSLCVNTAASLAMQKPAARVICVDLALPLGSVGDLIRIEPENTIAVLSTLEQAKLDQFAVGSFLVSREGLGFEALLGARDLAEAQQVNPNTIEAILRHLQTIADYIFVDVGRNVSRVSLPVLKISNRIVMVLSADLTSLRLNRVALNYFTSLNITGRQIVLVANRAVGREGKSNAEAEQLLQHAIFTTVPYERDRFTVASNMGDPLVIKEPNCPAAMSLQELAQHLLKI